MFLKLEHLAMSNTTKVLDPTFHGVGQRLGTEIWRIENFQPVPLPKSEYGKFYMGDSYVVLQTSQGKSFHLVAEEVKALSDCISQVKKIIDHYGDSDGLAVPTSSICQMQSLMLLIMGYVANVLMCNITSAQVISDQVESNCFVDATIVSANFSIIAGPHLSKLKLI
ncbi:hypothetical protein KIW84_058310 [Lathyrus oleraceus]|uniref:Uncharacterized protein n=1 Tax=Pisum sativum TaxID=3888 RepID=A0A9D4X8G4_PEA|nr:hypothetical protein KIW84_058310 [Pisum sativum]